MTRYRLDSPYELGAAPRLGGSFDGPKNDTTALWKGRPPTLVDGLTPNVISIAMRSTGTLPVGVSSRSVTIRAEGGNAFGGIITREFSVGEGLSADLGIGAFQHCLVRAITPIPAGCTLFFCWVNELTFSSSLLTLSSYLNYPVANTRVRVPEGAFEMMAENACQITWTLDQLGATVTQGVAAGESIPVRWGTFSCNVVNQFFFRLRGF
jgi:hypothetical protein